MTRETPGMQTALCTRCEAFASPLHTFRVGAIRFCVVNSYYLDTLCSTYILNNNEAVPNRSRITKMHATRQWIGTSHYSR